MTTLAAVRVLDGEIVQFAGHASSVSISPAKGGFILHGAKGPAPDKWVQSPDSAVIGWGAVDGGVRIWTDHPEPTIRFVPDIEPVADDEGAMTEPLPEPDWSRVLSIKDAMCSQVDRKRDEIIDSGIEFDGVRYQTRPQDRENIAGTATLAILQPDAPIQWIAEDNSINSFTSEQFLAFAKAVAAHKAQWTFAARERKDVIRDAQDLDSLPDWP